MSDEVREIPVKKIYQVNCTESVATSFVHKLLCHHTEQSCKPDPTNPNMDHFHHREGVLILTPSVLGLAGSGLRDCMLK